MHITALNDKADDAKQETTLADQLKNPAMVQPASVIFCMVHGLNLKYLK